MEITSRPLGPHTVVAIIGRLDTATCGQLDAFLARAIEGGAHKLVFDLAQLEYLSSAGLRTLLATAKRLRPLGGRVAVCSLTPAVQDVFRIAGFGSLMPVVADVEAALTAF
jgi:anti-sigma B factor antagonist